MNRFAKGSIAAGAGIVLLLGGAGTFALWNDTAEIGNATIQAGELRLDTTGTGGWDAVPANWVPGDSATYTDTLTLTAVGDNIAAILSVDESSITGDADLLADLEIEFTVGAVTGGTVVDNGDGSYSISAAGSYTIPVEVSVSFDAASSNATQLQQVDLTTIAFKVQQTV